MVQKAIITELILHLFVLESFDVGYIVWIKLANVFPLQRIACADRLSGTPDATRAFAISILDLLTTGCH